MTPPPAIPVRVSAPRLRAALRLALAMTPLAMPAAWAETARYQLDPVHTRVLFAISHAGFSQALGTVSGSQGTLQFDPEDWSGAHLEVSVPLQRLDLGDADWNRAVLARDLLDASRWPEARFVSTRVEPLAADRFIVHGQLTLHGITRDVPLEVRFNQLKRHPLPPFHRTAGFSATATLSRKAFGIDAWPSVIGDSIELRIEAEAQLARRAPAPGEAPGRIPADDDTPADPPAAADEPAAPPPPASPPERKDPPTP